MRKAGVAGGKYSRVRRSQMIVNLDACLAVVFDADCLEIQALDIRDAACPDKDLVCGALELLALLLEDDGFFVFSLPHPDNSGVRQQLNAIVDQGLLDDVRGIGILAG
jgi:hypothetical protein